MEKCSMKLVRMSVNAVRNFDNYYTIDTKSFVEKFFWVQVSVFYCQQKDKIYTNLMIWWDIYKKWQYAH